MITSHMEYKNTEKIYECQSMNRMSDRIIFLVFVIIIHTLQCTQSNSKVEKREIFSKRIV